MTLTPLVYITPRDGSVSGGLWGDVLSCALEVNPANADEFTPPPIAQGVLVDANIDEQDLLALLRLLREAWAVPWVILRRPGQACSEQLLWSTGADAILKDPSPAPAVVATLIRQATFLQDQYLMPPTPQPSSAWRPTSDHTPANRRVLQEIHHRFRNNLTVIASVLSLQADESPEPARQPLLDSAQRVRAMALIHERLFQTDNLDHIDFFTYVGNLIALAQRASSASPALVRVFVEGDDVYLSLDKAIPCGFLLNELLLDRLNTAFPDPASGQLSVHLNHSRRRMVVEVRDDGIPPSSDYLGGESNRVRQLVLLDLAEQLGGALRVDPGHPAGDDAPGQATVFTLHFPLNVPTGST